MTVRRAAFGKVTLGRKEFWSDINLNDAQQNDTLQNGHHHIDTIQNDIQHNDCKQNHAQQMTLIKWQSSK